MDAALKTTLSRLSYTETVQALLATIERRGLRLFAQIDHAAAAREVGLDLANEQVLIFGDPRGGTPLMRADPQIGIELPLRILVWEAGDRVVLGYRDPRELGDRYMVVERRATLEAMAALLEGLANEAAG